MEKFNKLREQIELLHNNVKTCEVPKTYLGTAKIELEELRDTVIPRILEQVTYAEKLSILLQKVFKL